MAPSFRSSDLPAPGPVFPGFKPLRLADRDLFRTILWDYQPETSELTFTNLWMWRSHYGYQWSLDRDRLVVVSAGAGGEAWALPPVGPPPRVDLCRRVLGWLRMSAGWRTRPLSGPTPGWRRSWPARPDSWWSRCGIISITCTLPRTLSGCPAGFLPRQAQPHQQPGQVGGLPYETLGADHLAACRELSGRWCDIKRCDLDMSLMGERAAIDAALGDFQALGLQGGVILVNDRLEAFSCGERLNQRHGGHTPGEGQSGDAGPLCGHQPGVTSGDWAGVEFINREQDLGEPGLRTAKLSYHPPGWWRNFASAWRERVVWQLPEVFSVMAHAPRT